MQEAIPYKAFCPGQATGIRMNGRRNEGTQIRLKSGGDDDRLDAYVRELVSENSIIVFGRQGCCMSHVVKRLLLGLGVNPPVYEIDEKDEGEVTNELIKINAAGKGNEFGHSGLVQFPVVFVGGRLFGGLDTVMATHISGDLVPILKEAGVLWL